MSATTALGGGANTQKTFADYKTIQLDLISDKDRRETYIKDKEGDRYYNVTGKLYKIAYRDVTFNDKSFTVVYMTLVNTSTKEVFFISAYQNMYTTDNLMNKLSTLTNDDLGKEFKVMLGTVSQPVLDADGNKTGEWDKRLDSNGQNIPRFDIKMLDGENTRYLRDLLWETQNKDNQCTHELMAEYKVLRKSAKKSSNGGGVNTFWRETITDHLNSLGFKSVNRDKPNYKEYNLLNEVVINELKSTSTNGLENTSESQVAEPAMTTTTVVEGDDSLPF